MLIKSSAFRLNPSQAPEPHYFITSSDANRSLVFVTKTEFEAYERDMDEVIAKHREIIKKKYGIWAPHQGKFVCSEAELTQWDLRSYV